MVSTALRSCQDTLVKLDKAGRKCFMYQPDKFSVFIPNFASRTSNEFVSVQTQLLSAAEEKIRSDIDGLLEQNLEFWLRFSTCFHQQQKYQASVRDLNSELSKLAENKAASLRSKVSDARPIFLHHRRSQSRRLGTQSISGCKVSW